MRGPAQAERHPTGVYDAFFVLVLVRPSQLRTTIMMLPSPNHRGRTPACGDMHSILILVSMFSSWNVSCGDEAIDAQAGALSVLMTQGHQDFMTVDDKTNVNELCGRRYYREWSLERS